ncbi:hypothetical protein ACIQ9Q_39810, partial [Streptomyces sp. NPDC094438]|uniref:hypothetical protein n=1 Tax=Streptomyces sp. NPDC094438 TaxID=3366061 RepID=UPI003826DD5C
MTETFDTRARRRRPPNRPAAPRSCAGVVGRFAALLGLVLVLVLVLGTVLAVLVLAAALVCELWGGCRWLMRVVVTVVEGLVGGPFLLSGVV